MKKKMFPDEILNATVSNKDLDEFLQNWDTRKRKFKIKRSVFWRQTTILSKHFIDHNLFITHHIIKEIQDLFIEKYNRYNFIKSSTNMNIPITVEQFEKELSQLCSHVKQILKKQWFLDAFAVIEKYTIIKNGKLEYLNVNTTFYNKKLFDCINSLLSAHLRLLLINILKDVANFFQQFSIPDKNSSFDGSLIFSVPFVIVNITFNASKQFVINPTVTWIHETIENFLLDLISVTNKESLLEITKIPGIDEILNLLPVAPEDFEIENLVKNILKSIRINVTNPEECLKHYETFVPILDGTFHEQLKQRISAESNFTLKEFDLEVEKYLRFSQLASNCSDKIQQNFIQIDCTSINNLILTNLSALYKELCFHVVQKLQDNNAEICKIFDDVAHKVSETPESTREVVELCSYLTECKDTTMYHLKSKLSRSADLLIFIVQYFPLSDENISLNTRTFTWPKEMEKILELGITRLNIRKEMLEGSLKAKRNNCAVKTDQLKTQIGELKKKDLPLLTENEAKFFVAAVDNLSRLMDDVMSEANNINEEETLLDIELTTFSDLVSMNSMVKSLHTLWHSTHEFLIQYDKWYFKPVQSLDIDEILNDVQKMENVLQSLAKDVLNISAVRKATEILRNRIDTFKKYIPLLQIICNHSFRERHWVQVGAIVNQKLDSKVLSLSQVINFELDKHLVELQEISANATKEFELEKNLSRMYREWDDKFFQLEPHRDTQVTVLCQVDDIQVLLDDHILKVQTLRSQPSMEVFAEDVLSWEEKLILVQDIIDQWLSCQTAWINLEPIFNSDDIAWQMPTEAEEFKKVDVVWRTLMETVRLDARVLDITQIDDIIGQFRSCNAMLHEINKSLDDYLDRKRSLFARFYFLTNKELSALISISKNLSTVQAQLYKCFEGIQAVQVTRDDEIVGIVSTQNEYIPFSGRIYFAEMKGFIEKWMIQLEDNMRSSIRDICQDTITSYSNYSFKDWVLSWPGQSVVPCYQIYWTSYATESIRKNLLEDFLKKQIDEMECILSLMNESFEAKHFSKIATLVMLNLHAQEVTRSLAKKKVSIRDFEWLSQMRFYWLNGNITISNVTTNINYGFECIGNNSRLVITPGTERCLKLIMNAMRLNLYSVLEGPSATGKTETLKDLAKLTAKQLVVLFCSSYTQYKLTNNILKGVIQSGAWLCLDNLHEARMEMLSVLMQQILTVQIAVKSRVEKLNFEGTDMKLNPSCCFFATMISQPTKVPNNLKTLFRIVAMIQPDYKTITEITLSTYGVKDSKNLATKVLHFLRVLSNQLFEDNCVFNLYDLNGILNQVRFYLQGSFGLSEDQIVLSALRDVILPRVATEELFIFESISRAIFGSVTWKVDDQDEFKNCIRRGLDGEYAGLGINDWYVDKIVQLHEILIRKRGVILVGKSMTGKTRAYKTLARTHNVPSSNTVSLSEQRKVTFRINDLDFRVINPTAVSFEELYGKYDKRRHEWTDGIFVKTCREFVTTDIHDKKWIILDGSAERSWMEYLNPIFDSSKKLYLFSGEVMQIPESLTVMLELVNLNDTSPATICRCGILYFDANNVGWRDVYNSYKIDMQKRLADDQSNVVLKLVEWLTEPLLNFMKLQCKSFVTVSDSHKFLMFMKLFNLMIEPESNISTLWLQCTLLFSIIWGLCSTIDNNSRKLIDTFYRSLLAGKVTEHSKPKVFKLSKSQLFPEKAMVFNWVYDKLNNGSWLLWTDVIPKVQKKFPKLEFLGQPIENPTILTKEACIMNSFLLTNIIDNNIPTVLIGPSGTGKTTVCLNFMKKLSPLKYTHSYMTLKVALTPPQTQHILTVNLDRRRKEVYGPPMGKTCVMFIDDLCAERPDPKSNKSLELLRQWVEHGHLVDYDSLKFSYLIDIVLLGTMLPDDRTSAQNMDRFIRHTFVVGTDHLDSSTVTNIFTTIIESKFARSNINDLGTLSKDIITATINVMEKTLKEFPPVERREHYIFHMNDIHRVVKGLTFVSTGLDSDSNKAKFTKLWLHEMCRNFCDRLISEEDKSKFITILKSSGKSHVQQFSRIFENLGSVSDLLFCPIFNANGTIKAYDEMEKLTDFEARLRKIISEYNEESDTKIDFVLFGSSILHLARILRILLFTNEHLILLGLLGTGKNFNIKLVSIITKYLIFEVEDGISNYEEWRCFVKNALVKIGTTNSKVFFKVTDEDVREESYLHDFHTLLSTGDVLHNFTTEEETEIVKKMIDQLDTERNQVHSNATDILNLFCERIILNLRLVFMSSLDKLRKKPFIFSTVAKYCTVDWYFTWPKEALQEVASFILGKLDLESNLVEKFSDICEFVHSSMYDFCSEKPNQLFVKCCISPIHFFQFINCFVDLYHQKLHSILHQKGQYDIGLAKLNQVANQVGIMQTELRDLQPKLQVKSQLSDKLMIKIEQDTINVEARKEVVAADEALANEAAAAAQAIKDDCESDLAEASPALETALTALNTLKPSDITIIKSMKNPPAGVRLVMEAVCVLKGVKPEKVQDPVSGQIIDDYWQASTKILGDIKFLENLKTFDKDNIPPANMKKIRETYMHDRSFQPEIIRKTSMACEGLCKWIRAMEVYDRVIKVVAPKKTMLFAAEAELTVQMETLNSKRALLQDVTDKLQQLNDEFAECLREKRDLENQIDVCIQKLDRAEKLLGGLNNERIRWSGITLKLENKSKNMVGDILLASAFIVYMATLNEESRRKIMKTWLGYCDKLDIPFNKEFVFHDVFMEKEDTKSWIMNGLPEDDFVIDNAVIVKETNKFPLIVDPHSQASRWIMKIEKDNRLLVIDFNDSDYFDKVERCIELGLPALLKNVSQIDGKLCKFLRRIVYESSGESYIKLKDKELKFNKNFRIYITSLMSDLPGLSKVVVHISLVNFSITPKGLESKLLKSVVSEKSQALSSTKEQLTFEFISNNRSLKEIEDNILQILSSSEGNILDDENTLKTLSSSKGTAEGIRAKQLIIKNTLEDIEKSEQNFGLIAEHATSLFFAIAELSFLNPNYRFSIDWFFHIFVSAIKNMSDCSSEEDLKQFESKLNSVYYEKISRSLLTEDHLIFSFILTIFLARKENQMRREWLDFLLNQNVQDQIHQGSPIIWLPNENWTLVTAASSLPGFEQWDQLILKNSSAWKKFYFEDYSSGKIPKPFENENNNFKKLIIFKCLKRDKIVDILKNTVSDKLGPSFSESPPLDTLKVYNDSKNVSPILIICTPGKDPVNYIKIAAKEQGLQRKQLLLLSLDEDRTDLITTTIKKSIRNGEWIIIQNCHLFIKQMDHLGWLVENVISCPEAHSDFRLWLTSSPCDMFPPSLILKCTKIVIDEKTKIVNSKLEYFMSELEESGRFDSREKNLIWKRFVWSTYFYHLNIRERSFYGLYGWNEKYSFNDEDLKMSLNHLKVLRNYYDNLPTEICKYLVGECVYESNISDSNDRRWLTAMSKLHLETILFNEPKSSYEKQLNLLLDNLPHLDSDFNLTGLSLKALSLKQIEEGVLFMKKVSQTELSNTSTDNEKLSLKESLLTLQVQIPSSFNLEKARDVLERKNYVHLFLMNELVKFNNLIRHIQSSLQRVTEMLEGKRVEEPSLSLICKDIVHRRVPGLWRHLSYPSSKPLGSYIKDLEMRQNFYHNWLERRTSVVWASGLFSISSFVISELMNHCLKRNVHIQDLSLSYEITVYEENNVEPTASGIYLSGFYLDGARWNRIRKSLDESVSKIKFEKLPLIYLQPSTTERAIHKNYYYCPVYITPTRRESVLLNLQFDGEEFCIALPTKNSDDWIHRGIACLCQTDD